MSGADKAIERAEAPRGGTWPFARFEWLMALRYLRARRTEGYISFITVISFLSFALGVSALIIIMAVMNGLRADLQNKILGFKGHIEVAAASGPTRDFDALTQRLAAIPGVRLALPFVEGQALASSRYQAGGIYVRGLHSADIARLPGMSKGLVDGTLDDFDKGEGIVLGVRLASQLGLQVGDSLMLLAPNNGPQTPGTPPRARAFPVAGLYEVGHSDIDSEYVLMPLPKAQDFLGQPDSVTGIEVYAADPMRLQAISAAIAASPGAPLRQRDWTERDRTLFGALVVERNVMFVILVLIVLIAAFNIVASLIMMVRDKSADIAILRTMGATGGAVARIFMIAGSAIGVAGTLAGLAFGLGFAANIDRFRQLVERWIQPSLFPDWLYFLSRLPALIDTAEVVVVVAVALVTAVLATLYPSLRAARLDPVAALRYE